MENIGATRRPLGSKTERKTRKPCGKTSEADKLTACDVPLELHHKHDRYSKPV